MTTFDNFLNEFTEAARNHQDRLVKKLVAASRYTQGIYLLHHNAEFRHAPQEVGSAIVPLLDTALDNLLCEKHECGVGCRCIMAPGCWPATGRTGGLLDAPQTSHRRDKVAA